MKKILIYSLLLCFILIIAKYGLSNYKMSYKIDNYSINMKYKNSRFYYEIKDGDITYNFDIYANRSFKKQEISKIEKISDEKFECIYPTIKNVDTYPLCSINKEIVDFHLIDSELLDKYKKAKEEDNKLDRDFIYYNNLSNNEYVALWNYKGYIVMNGNNYNNVDMFEKDKYDNSLAYLLDHTIYMANNDEEHEYSVIIGLDLKDLSIDEFKIDYNIDFDSYIVGHVNNNLYIFDNKYSILYEINVKDQKATIIGNNEKGYVKYENNKFVSCSKSEYKIDKIKYNTYKSNYKYENNNGFYKTILDNTDIKQKLFNKSINFVSEKQNYLYYSSDDSFYKYDPLNGSIKVFYNYELKFNDSNSIFVYKK